MYISCQSSVLHILNRILSLWQVSIFANKLLSFIFRTMSICQSMEISGWVQIRRLNCWWLMLCRFNKISPFNVFNWNCTFLSPYNFLQFLERNIYFTNYQPKYTKILFIIISIHGMNKTCVYLTSFMTKTFHYYIFLRYEY